MSNPAEAFCSPTHQDEAGVIPVPPAERRHADFWVLVVMENLTSAVGVSAQDEPGLKPLQKLKKKGRRKKGQNPLRSCFLLSLLLTFIMLCVCSSTLILLNCIYLDERETHPLRSLFGQHVILLSEQQVSLLRRCCILPCAAGVTHSVQRVMLEDQNSRQMLNICMLNVGTREKTPGPSIS